MSSFKISGFFGSQKPRGRGPKKFCAGSVELQDRERA